MIVSKDLSKMKGLWDELQNYKTSPACSYGAVKILSYSHQQENVMQLFMGLNESDMPIRSQILLIDPLPPIN